MLQKFQRLAKLAGRQLSWFAQQYVTHNILFVQTTPLGREVMSSRG